MKILEGPCIHTGIQIEKVAILVSLSKEPSLKMDHGASERVKPVSNSANPSRFLSDVVDIEESDFEIFEPKLILFVN